MSFSNEEFQFALEMIIARRNASGATLSDIQADYYNAFGVTLESMFGNSWSEQLRNLMLNNLDNLFTKQEPGGYTLYFIGGAELQKKIYAMSHKENIRAILKILQIDPNNIKTNYAHGEQVQSSLNSTGLRSVSSFRSTPPKLSQFYNHTLIADNFFLELSHIDLQMPKSKKNFVERIGLCMSGHTIKSACRTMVFSTYQFSTPYLILNIGTFDILNGRSVEQLIADIVRLLNAAKSKNLEPILTTLAPMPNHLAGEMQEKRLAFNKFIRENFLFIDIESCFLSNENRVLLECYQKNPVSVGGSKHPIILWNRVGRQRVLQLMKREIPNIHPWFFKN